MEILTPAQAAALHELQVLDPRRRPMLAAHWVAQGGGGEVLAELAGLRGDEHEVDDLWPAALAELGVPTPVGRARRVAVAWLAQRVTSGEQDVDWLIHVLWPTRRKDTDEDDLMDTITYTIDHVTDDVGTTSAREANAGRLGRRRVRREREGAEQMRRNVDAALVALAEGDVDTAADLLGVTRPAP